MILKIVRSLECLPFSLHPSIFSWSKVMYRVYVSFINNCKPSFLILTTLTDFSSRQFKEQQRLNRQGETSSTAYRMDQKISDPGPGPTRSSYLSGHATRSESAHATKSVLYYIQIWIQRFVCLSVWAESICILSNFKLQSTLIVF